MLVTLLAIFLVALALGQGAGRSVFMGVLVSLSSTAIVLKILQEKAEVDSSHGKIVLAILIFQDVVAVPMMLLIPLMAGTGGAFAETLVKLSVKGLAVVLLALVSARWLVPQVLYQVARTRSRELFLLTVVVMCFAVAWLTSSIGLSLALGAFLAGLVISESEYSYQALSNLLPFRDLFTSIFFISVGMLVDMRIFLQHPGMIAVAVLSIMVIKALIAGGAAALLGYPLRTMILTGLALNQVGEFSFILSKAGVAHGLLSGAAYQGFLAVSVVTMAATPFIMASSRRTADWFGRLPVPQRVQTGLGALPAGSAAAGATPEDHLLIIGYGVNGRNVARAAAMADIPYMIVETNPVTVKQEKTLGQPIYYGDASQEAVLEHVGIHAARVLVVGIPDPVSTRMVVAAARKLQAKLYIIARTRYQQEMEPLYKLGANEVIPEEFETSIEIFSRVLAKYLLPRDEIERLVAEVRNDGYGMLRRLSAEATSFCTASSCHHKFFLPDAEICSLRVTDGAPITGKSLADVGLRKDYGVTLLSIRRNTETISNPGADTVFFPEDIAVLVGTPAKLAGVRALFGT